jgi:fructokinase
MAGRVVMVGEVLIDFLGEGGEALEEASAFRPSPGGAPANAAVAAARAGAPAAFAGCVGLDAFGRLLRATLEGAGVDCSALRARPDLFTTLAFVMPRARGDHGFQFMRGADAALDAADLPAGLFTGVAAVGCGGVSLSAPASRRATLEALRRARAAGALAAFDVNWRPRLWTDPRAAVAAAREAIALADLVKCNEGEIDLLCGPSGSLEARARSLLGAGRPSAALVTLGERGAIWVTVRNTVAHPGFAVEAVDAVGAGDCFLGTLLAWWALRDPGAPGDLPRERVHEVLARCCAAAALSTTRTGVMQAMPAAAEVDALLARG